MMLMSSLLSKVEHSLAGQVELECLNLLPALSMQPVATRQAGAVMAMPMSPLHADLASMQRLLHGWRQAGQ